MASTAATTPQDGNSPVAGAPLQDEHSPARVGTPPDGDGPVEAGSPRDSTQHASPDPPSKPTSGPAAPVRLPPGPRASAVLQTLAWALAPTWVMDQCAKRMGEAFTLTFAPSGMKLVMVSDPEAVKTVFTAPPEVAPSGAGSSPIAPIMGPSSVIVLTGPEHMRQRKLLLPPFHGERMREYESTIVEATRRDMASWELGRPMRLQERTRAITLEVIVRAVFGVEAERMATLTAAIGALLEPVSSPRMVLLTLRRWSLDRPTGAIGEGLDALDAVIYEELARRRAQADLAERTDILSLLMQARDEDDQAMTDGELRDELVTLLLAGHETTATSVAWAIERLVRHPAKLARLQAEIDAGSRGTGGEDGARGAAGIARGEDVTDGVRGAGGPGDEYMTAVVNETLRVRPVVPLVARMLTQELCVGGYTLPAGTRVTPSIYLTNRNPRAYAQPAEFIPERFLGKGPETFSWIPFGGGIRRCIGASFAQLEMKLMLRTMLSELEPRLPARGVWRRGEWNRRRAITLVPAAGTRVVWSRRAG
jgi:cytochrome P450 family 135